MRNYTFLHHFPVSTSFNSKAGKNNYHTALTYMGCWLWRVRDIAHIYIHSQHAVEIATRFLPSRNLLRLGSSFFEACDRSG